MPGSSAAVGESGAIARVRPLVAPIVADLGLDVYDLEHRGGVLRLTLDTPLGVAEGVTLDSIALASRLISKELDAADPIASRYTLEVTSPGIERPLRTADHFRRAIGQQVALRLADVDAAERRVSGVVVAADDTSVTVDVEGAERRIEHRQIDRARTVFEWQAQPKGAAKSSRKRPATTDIDTTGADVADAADEQLVRPGNANDASEGEQS